MRFLQKLFAHLTQKEPQSPDTTGLAVLPVDAHYERQYRYKNGMMSTVAVKVSYIRSGGIDLRVKGVFKVRDAHATLHSAIIGKFAAQFIGNGMECFVSSNQHAQVQSLRNKS